jgi:hypothetical protein
MFDLSKVLENAQSVTEKSAGNSDLPRILYPGDGSVSVRLLFNPSSNSVMRLIRRHKTDKNEKIICASQYHEDCPLCKAIENINSMTGNDLWTLKSRVTGIAYAQYISCSQGYDWGSYGAPKEGDLVVLMFPWSLYKELSGIIQRSGEHANELLTTAQGRVITITRGKDGSRVSYKAEINAFAPLYESRSSQEEFDNWLVSMDNLNSVIVPEMMPSDLLMKLQIEADSLMARYTKASHIFPGTTPIPNNNNVGTMVGTVATPAASLNTESVSANPTVVPQADATSIPPTPTSETPTVQPAAPVAAPSAGKECFGHLDISKKECLLCSDAIKCEKYRREQAAK